MATIYSNGGKRWNILGFNVTKRDALSSLHKISMYCIGGTALFNHRQSRRHCLWFNTTSSIKLEITYVSYSNLTNKL